jgi:hypothetical protein
VLTHSQHHSDVISVGPCRTKPKPDPIDARSGGRSRSVPSALLRRVLGPAGSHQFSNSVADNVSVSLDMKAKRIWRWSRESCGSLSGPRKDRIEAISLAGRGMNLQKRISFILTATHYQRPVSGRGKGVMGPRTQNDVDQCVGVGCHFGGLGANALMGPIAIAAVRAGHVATAAVPLIVRKRRFWPCREPSNGGARCLRHIWLQIFRCWEELRQRGVAPRSALTSSIKFEADPVRNSSPALLVMCRRL